MYINFLSAVTFWQTHRKRCLSAEAFCLDISTVKVADFFYYGKSDAVSLRGMGLVRLIEFIKNMRNELLSFSKGE